MAWRPLIVGIDRSPEGVAAARAGVDLAHAMGTTCTLVHAARNVWQGASGTPGVVDVGALSREIEELSQADLVRALKGQVPSDPLAGMVVRVGPPAKVLQDEAKARGSDLVLLGARRHGVVSRWLGGSTARTVLRSLDLSVLITTGPRAPERILAAVDLSELAGSVIRTAERLAGLFDAKLRVLHTIEPFPYNPEGAVLLDVEALDRQEEEVFRKTIQPQVTHRTAEVVIRRAGALLAIEDEALAWRPDLVVVGAHGRGRLERLVLGSVSEGVVQMLPASVLVVRGAGPGGE